MFPATSVRVAGHGGRTHRERVPRGQWSNRRSRRSGRAVDDVEAKSRPHERRHRTRRPGRLHRHIRRRGHHRRRRIRHRHREASRYPLFPATSLAEHVTVVAPTGNVSPERSVIHPLTARRQRAVDDVEHRWRSRTPPPHPHRSIASTVTSAGGVTTGAVVSVTDTEKDSPKPQCCPGPSDARTRHRRHTHREHRPRREITAHHRSRIHQIRRRRNRRKHHHSTRRPSRLRRLRTRHRQHRRGGVLHEGGADRSAPVAEGVLGMHEDRVRSLTETAELARERGRQTSRTGCRTWRRWPPSWCPYRRHPPSR